MKILFVSSGNFDNGVNSLIHAQGESLKKYDIELDYFTIKGKGFWGYLKNLKRLRNSISQKKYDIIHAHYSLSGWLALFAKKNEKLVVSLMGDDAYGSFNEFGKVEFISYFLILSTKILQPFPSALIVKSENMFKAIYSRKKTSIIPNGVDINRFYSIDKKTAIERLELFENEKKILFLGDPNDSRKNFTLAKKAIDILGLKKSFVIPYPVNHSEIPLFLSAADVLLFTSTAEGSPNVIKEAMACNCPIVSTDVGDVKWIIGNTEGCFLTSFNAEDVAKKLSMALEYALKKGRTKGKDRIIELGMDSESIAKKIIDVYKRVLN